MSQIQKYILSKRFQFIPQKNWKASFKGRQLKDKIGLYDKFKDKVFVFDKIIADFIKIFKKPILIDDARNAFIKKYKLDAEIGQNKFDNFFKELLEFKFLVSEQQAIKSKVKDTKYFKIGDFIDQYKITKHFNSHDTFQVYEALDENSKKVIVKLYQLKDGYTADEKEYAHAVLYRELIILKCLCNHPSISNLIEYDESKNYGIIEFIQGTSLRKFAISKTNQYSLRDVMTIWRQILDSVAYLHRNDYIHGDLHYSNILLEEGNNVRLIDFGLALHTSEVDSPNIRKGGIHAFLPPERLNDSYFNIVQSNANISSDIYQVGILAYILLYRKVPFKAKTWKLITLNIKNHLILFPDTSASGELIPIKLIECIQKCIHPDIKKRAQNLEPIIRQVDLLIKKQKKNS